LTLPIRSRLSKRRWWWQRPLRRSPENKIKKTEKIPDTSGVDVIFSPKKIGENIANFDPKYCCFNPNIEHKLK
jgi:hypothetical protein